MTQDMMDSLSRLEWIHRDAGFQFDRHPPVTVSQLNEAQRLLGYEFTDELRDLWLFSNGSLRSVWFYLRSDLTFDARSQPFNFFPLEMALARRHKANEKWYDIWDGPPPGDPPGYRDPQIQPEYMRHQRWFGIGELPGGSHALRFDAIPTEQGQYGQLIVYQHDPDDVRYLAPNLVTLLQHTCDTLEHIRVTDPADLVSTLEYFSI